VVLGPANTKGAVPRRTPEGTVEFVTIWHAEEVVDALDAGALVSLDEVADDPVNNYSSPYEPGWDGFSPLAEWWKSPLSFASQLPCHYSRI